MNDQLAPESLALDSVSIARSGFEIVSDVDLRVPAGQVTVLLGANGAGKTTLLEGVSGVIPIKSGNVLMKGRDITSMRRASRARHGLSHVEQGRSVFGDLTADENLLTAAPATAFNRAYELFPALQRRRSVQAQLLSGGEQQMLVLARAILTDPQVLLLDEISLGLAPSIIQGLMPVVRQLADTGIAVLLVEQFANLALEIGDHAYVLNNGSIVFDGSCTELQQHPELLRGAYLAASAAQHESSGSEHTAQQVADAGESLHG